MALTKEQLLIVRSQVLIAMSKTALVIDRLDTWLKLNKFDPKFTDVEGEKLEMEGELMMLSGKLENLKISNGRLKPPDDTRMQRIAKLSNEVEELMKDQATADTMISLASKVVTLVSEVRAVASGAATG